VKPLRFEASFAAWMEARGMRHETLRYPRPGGDSLAFRLSPAGSPLARVLVAHGAGNDALYANLGYFKPLLSAGFEVFAPDLDGHGRHSTSRMRYPEVREAIPEAFRRAEAGGSLPTYGFGISLGGALLLRALGDGLPVRAAALVSAPLRIELSLRTVLNELHPSLLAAGLRERGDHGILGLLPSFGPVRRGTYPLRLEETAPGAFGYVRVLNGMLERMALEDAAAATTVPLLLAYGSSDRIVPPGQGERLAVAAPRAELVRVAGGRHLGTVLQPALRQHILRWLGAHFDSTAGPAERRA
jgi:alpha-beta hydrolase superfamily lysophospholipase